MKIVGSSSIFNIFFVRGLLFQLLTKWLFFNSLKPCTFGLIARLFPYPIVFSSTYSDRAAYGHNPFPGAGGRALTPRLTLGKSRPFRLATCPLHDAHKLRLVQSPGYLSSEFCRFFLPVGKDFTNQAANFLPVGKPVSRSPARRTKGPARGETQGWCNASLRSSGVRPRTCRFLEPEFRFR